MGSDAGGLHVLITGASRGIGLELVKQMLERGNKVVAGVRDPGTATLLQPLSEQHGSQLILQKLDVSDATSVQEAAAALSEKLPHLDILINNAGITGGMRPGCEETAEAVMSVYQTNMLGPLLTTQAFLPLLRKGGKKQIVNISSGGGSLGNAKDELEKEEMSPITSMALAYKASKAALNMQTLTLAAALKPEFTVISMCPGWVATDMGNTGSELFGGAKPTLTAETSVKGLLAVIDGLTPATSGSYIRYDGGHIKF